MWVLGGLDRRGSVEGLYTKTLIFLYLFSISLRWCLLYLSQDVIELACRLDTETDALNRHGRATNAVFGGQIKRE